MQTNDAETAKQIAALASVVSELRRLEQLLSEESQAQVDALEKFAVEPDLKRLRDLVEEHRGEFDALGFLKLSNDEEFHSNFLAWLLNPLQNHGGESYFLRHFLHQTGAQVPADTIDWSGTDVHREWVNEVDGQGGRLDILVVNQAEKFLCAIENKIWSWEHSEQLTRYRKALEAEYPGFTRQYILLSPSGVLPYWEEEQEYWTVANYKVVLRLVEQVISNSVSPVKEDVRAFLQQYATTLRREIVPDVNTNIAELARKIYFEHRQAIELIIQCKPDFADETKPILREAIAQHQRLKFDSEGPNIIRVRSADWDQFPTFKTGTAWKPSGSVLTFEFDFRPQHPYLVLMLGPGTDPGVRSKIYESVVQHQHVFSPTSQSLTSFAGLDKKGPIVDDSDFDNWTDQDAIRRKIMDWVNNFAENEFPAMNKVIVDCLREYEAERDGGQ